jgi:hypothetical protein
MRPLRYETETIQTCGAGGRHLREGMSPKARMIPIRVQAFRKPALSDSQPAPADEHAEATWGSGGAGCELGGWWETVRGISHQRLSQSGKNVMADRLDAEAEVAAGLGAGVHVRIEAASAQRTAVQSTQSAAYRQHARSWMDSSVRWPVARGVEPPARGGDVLARCGGALVDVLLAVEADPAWGAQMRQARGDEVHAPCPTSTSLGVEGAPGAQVQS